MSKFTCIVCPIGCTLSVERSTLGDLMITGNRCPKGLAYAREETLAPKRTVTAVVRTDSRTWPCIPVRTDQPLPRALIPGLLTELSRRTVHLPAARGGVLIADYGETGVNVVFTRTLPPPAPALHLY
jgi:CxxC motif-containing protein